MDTKFHKDFKSCPACGSTNRFFESMANELKDRGVVRKEWAFYLDIKQGVVMDKVKEQRLIIGSQVPAYTYATDICMDCGCVYAMFIERSNATKSIEPATNMPGPPLGQVIRSS